MSTRKRGTTNIALNVGEINLLKEGLQGLQSIVAWDIIEKLDKRLNKAIDRCLGRNK